MQLINLPPDSSVARYYHKLIDTEGDRISRKFKKEFLKCLNRDLAGIDIPVRLMLPEPIAKKVQRRKFGKDVRSLQEMERRMISGEEIHTADLTQGLVDEETGDKVWIIDRLVSFDIIDRQHGYFVKWEGFEPAREIPDGFSTQKKELREKYYANLERKLSRKTRK